MNQPKDLTFFIFHTRTIAIRKRINATGRRTARTVNSSDLYL